MVTRRKSLISAAEKQQIARRALEADEQLRRSLWLSFWDAERHRAVLPAALRHCEVCEVDERRRIATSCLNEVGVMRVAGLQEREAVVRKSQVAKFSVSRHSLIASALARVEGELRRLLERNALSVLDDVRSDAALAELPVRVDDLDLICAGLLAQPVSLPPPQRITAAAQEASSRGTPLDAFFRAAARAGLVHVDQEAPPDSGTPRTRPQSASASSSRTPGTAVVMRPFSASQHRKTTAAIYSSSPARIERRIPHPPSATIVNADAEAAPTSLEELLVAAEPQAVAAATPARLRHETATPSSRPQSARQPPRLAPTPPNLLPRTRPLSAKSAGSGRSSAAAAAATTTPWQRTTAVALSAPVSRASAIMSAAADDGARQHAYQRLLVGLGNAPAAAVVDAVLLSMRSVQMRTPPRPKRQRRRPKKAPAEAAAAEEPFVL